MHFTVDTKNLKLMSTKFVYLKTQKQLSGSTKTSEKNHRIDFNNSGATS